MNRYVIWPTGFIFVIILPRGNQDENLIQVADCILHDSVEGLQTINCTGKIDDRRPWRFPITFSNNDTTSSIKIIDLTKSYAMTLLWEPFRYYYNVQRIIIKQNYIMHLAEPERDIKLFEKLFIGLNQLHFLEYSESYLSDEYQWRLPKSLKTYIVDRNKYKHLDVHWCPTIEEISANHNFMEAVPIFSDPYPPLRILRLLDNPMHNLTAEDIAPLCEFKILELSFTADSLLSKPEKYCECKKLEAWIKERNITGTRDFMCSEKKKDCPANFLETARRIHQESCELKTATRSILSINMLAWFLGFLLLIVIATFLFVGIQYLIAASGAKRENEFEVEEEIVYEYEE